MLDGGVSFIEFLFARWLVNEQNIRVNLELLVPWVPSSKSGKNNVNGHRLVRDLF